MINSSRSILFKTFKYSLSLIYFVACMAVVFFITSVATNRYTTEAHFTITKDQKAQAVNAMELLGFGSTLGTADTQLAIGYIHSVDLLTEIDKKFEMEEHFSKGEYDPWFRLKKNASLEEKLEYFKKRIHARLDDTTGMVKVKVESYDPEYSQRVCRYLLDKSEKYINNLNKSIANERFQLVENERDKASASLTSAKDEYAKVQAKFKFVAPDEALQSKYERLNQLKMQITQIKATINQSTFDKKDKKTALALFEKEYNETLKLLTGPEKDKFNSQLNELKSKEYNVIRAQEIFNNTLIMYNQTRVDSIAKSRFFSRIQEPYLPQEALEPRRAYLACSFAFLALLLFIILKILINSILSH